MTKKRKYPSLATLGDTTMLCFVTTDGMLRMVATELVDSIAAHRTKPGMSVVWISNQDEEGDERAVIPVPSIHSPEDFMSLGIEKKPHA